MNIPCGVNASGERPLDRSGVCAADVNAELAEGEVLLGNGAYVGPCSVSVAVLQQGGRKLMAVRAGRRAPPT